jgi:CRISPR-associated protein Cmr4
MDYSIMCMYAVTPCHAGSGSALATVDLPIQRERHTNWPVIQASGMKGALRANFDRYERTQLKTENAEEFKGLTNKIFGARTSEDSGGGYAGSMSVSDAKILAFPMRSNIAPFVWITCPAVLKRLYRDLNITGEPKEIDFVNIDKAVDKKLTALCVTGNLSGKILLEDMEVEVPADSTVIAAIKPLLEYFPEADRLLIVSDTIFDYGVTCTPVAAHITIDQEKGTTKDSSLRYQEELPADTLMYCVIHWGDTRDGSESLKAETIRKYVKDTVIKKHIQVGGDETMGRGIFALVWK